MYTEGTFTRWWRNSQIKTGPYTVHVGASGALFDSTVSIQKWSGPDQFFDGSIPNILCHVRDVAKGRLPANLTG